VKDSVYIIQKISSSYSVDKIIDFCKLANNDKRPSAVNMDYIDWENKPHTFLYKLFIEKRFDGDRAGYFIYKENDKIVAGSGYSPFTIDENMYCQSRSYAVPAKNLYDQRQGIIKLTMVISDDSFYRGYSGGVLSFEPHNEEFAEKLRRVEEKHTKSPTYYTRKIGDKIYQHYKKDLKRCIPLTRYEHIVNYNYSKQIIMYHLFDLDYEKTLITNLDKARVND
jgi:hypothetical protein